VETAIDRAETLGASVIAVHSHPGGLFQFSDVDDASDHLLMPALYHGTRRVCGSAIMTPGGALRARMYETGETAAPFDLVMNAGPEIRTWWDNGATSEGPSPVPVAFTTGMRDWLGRMSACVIGVSGTGSIVAEQLARFGFGEIILIDFDRLEERNLNRIINSATSDIGSFKVDMFAGAIRRYRTDCDVVALPDSVATRDAVLAACEADVLFSCVDTAEGRHIADRIAAYFAMPLLDVGVSIPTRADTTGQRQIAEVYGRIDYVFPGASSLMNRGVYDSALLEAEYLARIAPQAHRKKVADGYIRGIVEEAPSVIALNMRAASACMLEFVARAFPFRQFPNESRARTIFMLAEGDEDTFADNEFEAGKSKFTPFLINGATEFVKWLTSASTTGGKRFILALLSIVGVVSLSALNGVPGSE
jgi:ThiF family